MTFDKWVKDNIGKAIDYDKAYGVQCVDLVKHYVKNVLDITPQSIGNAIEYYNKRKTSTYLICNFVWINNTPTFIPKRGDIGVFKSKTGHGHICVCDGVGDTHSFYSYDQNYPHAKHEPMTRIKHTYDNFLGVLRPINQKNISKGLCSLFNCNASAKSDCEVYCDNLYKTKVGKIIKSERIRVLGNCKNDYLVQFSTSDKTYKIGIVKKDKVIKD